MTSVDSAPLGLGDAERSKESDEPKVLGKKDVPRSRKQANEALGHRIQKLEECVNESFGNRIQKLEECVEQEREAFRKRVDALERRMNGRLDVVVQGQDDLKEVIRQSVSKSVMDQCRELIQPQEFLNVTVAPGTGSPDSPLLGAGLGIPRRKHRRNELHVDQTQKSNIAPYGESYEPKMIVIPEVLRAQHTGKAGKKVLSWRVRGRSREQFTAMGAWPSAKFSPHLTDDFSVSDCVPRSTQSPMQPETAGAGGLASIDEEDEAPNPFADMGVELPRPSMYCYLVDSFNEASSASAKLRVAVQLLILLAWHWSLSFAVFDVSVLHTFIYERVWTDKIPYHKLYGRMPDWITNKHMVDTPLTLFCGIGSVMVISLSLANDSRQIFCAPPTPKRQRTSAPLLEDLFLSLAWLARATLLPCYVAIGAVMMVAEAEDALDIVVNSVAATFLLELDDFVYANFLSSHERMLYELKRERRAVKQASRTDLTVCPRQQARFQERVAAAFTLLEGVCLCCVYVFRRLREPTMELEPLAATVLCGVLAAARAIAVQLCRPPSSGPAEDRAEFVRDVLRKAMCVLMTMSVWVIVHVMGRYVFGFDTNLFSDCVVACIEDLQSKPASCSGLWPPEWSPMPPHACSTR